MTKLLLIAGAVLVSLSLPAMARDFDGCRGPVQFLGVRQSCLGQNIHQPQTKGDVVQSEPTRKQGHSQSGPYVRPNTR